MTKFSREETFGWQDLIAFFGGIVGLCMGFSLLSGAEFLYWFTLRLLVDQAGKLFLNIDKYLLLNSLFFFFPFFDIPSNKSDPLEGQKS